MWACYWIGFIGSIYGNGLFCMRALNQHGAGGCRADNSETAHLQRNS